MRARAAPDAAAQPSRVISVHSLPWAGDTWERPLQLHSKRSMPKKASGKKGVPWAGPSRCGGLSAGTAVSAMVAVVAVVMAVRHASCILMPTVREFTLDQLGEAVGLDDENYAAVPVSECTFGKDFETVEGLFLRDRPCLVRGLSTEWHEAAVREWSPEKLSGLPSSAGAVFEVYQMEEGKSMSGVGAKIMRFRHRTMPRYSPVLNGTWPTDTYDEWEIKRGTMMKSILQPQSGVYGSFSAKVVDFAGPHPAGSKAAQDLVDSVCPHGCLHNEILTQSQIWLASRGLGQGFHFDQSANLFFHLHGDNSQPWVPLPVLPPSLPFSPLSLIGRCCNRSRERCFYKTVPPMTR